MPSRKIEDCHPELQFKLRRFLDLCARSKIDVLITCTFRSPQEQAELYAIGRDKPGKIVTNARPGTSRHNFMIGNKPASKAFDFVPMRHGKPVWSTAGDDMKLWEACGKIGESVGLEWAGRWVRFKEMAHFQID